MSTIEHVILVHGAWTDSTSWIKARALIEAASLNTTTVNLPLTSLAADADVVSRSIDAAPGPVLRPATLAC